MKLKIWNQTTQIPLVQLLARPCHVQVSNLCARRPGMTNVLLTTLNKLWQAAIFPLDPASSFSFPASPLQHWNMSLDSQATKQKACTNLAEEMYWLANCDISSTDTFGVFSNLSYKTRPNIADGLVSVVLLLAAMLGAFWYVFVSIVARAKSVSGHISQKANWWMVIMINIYRAGVWANNSEHSQVHKISQKRKRRR